MDVDAEMQQRLLELAYDLLPEDQAADLRSRIASDPELARAYAEVQGTAKLFSTATRLPMPKIGLKRPTRHAPAAAESGRPKTTRGNGSGAKASVTPLARGANWAVMLASLVLLGLSTGGYFYHRGQLADIAAERWRVMVVGPARLCAGVSPQYAIATTSVTGEPVSTPIEYALFSPTGEQKGFHDKDETDEQGRLAVRVPSEHVVPGRGRLEIQAGSGSQTEQILVPLSIEPVRRLTELSLDRPVYRPGEIVRYRSLTLSQFGLAANREMPVGFEILDPKGAGVAGSRLEGVTQRGVGCGQFSLPAGLAQGQYALVAMSPDHSFLAQRQSFLVQKAGAPRPPTAAEIDAGKVSVSFYPEGGDLVAGMENRVYFAARNARGGPVAISGRIFNGRNQSIGRIESEHDGRGVFAFQPRPGEQYRLKIDKPADVKTETSLPEASSSERVVLTTGVGVFEAGRPLEFNVRAAEAGLPLVASAWCRGVAVGQQALVTEEDANSVRIPLDDAVAGVIRLTVYDYRVSPPRPFAERLVYRRPLRRLQVRLADPGLRHSPGQTVELSLSACDESGKPTPATLAVAVVDRDLLPDAADGAPAMPTRFLLSRETEDPEDLEKADFCLSDDPKAAVALDLLLGTQGWRRFAERKLAELRKAGRSNERLERLVATQGEAAPPAVFDNLNDIEAKHQDSLASYRANRTRMLNALTLVSLFGGAGLVLLVAMLALMNITAGIRLWATSLTVAATCLILGAILMNPERLQSAGEDAVAFASSNSETSETTQAPTADAKPADSTDKTVAKDVFPVRRYAYRRPAHAPGPPTDPPGVLFWHPLLVTDSSGKAQIRFDLPDRPARFGLIVDAHGHEGRLGSLAAEIVSGNPQGKR